ncbi:YcbK family protein [Sorangium sp. So ce131]|uniref:YcbK family protein n=1 Tax=Sorangium sp. So ce131 TaxID=3133282 RepID=UPI003F63BD37
MSSTGAAPQAAGEAMRSVEPRARGARVRAAALAALVSIAVPAVPAGLLHAGPLPGAQAAAKVAEGSGEQARRGRPPASPSAAGSARQTEARDRSPRRAARGAAAGERGEKKDEKAEKKSGAADRKASARGKAPEAAESADERRGGEAKEAKAGRKDRGKKKEKKRAARVAESKRRGGKKGTDREAPRKPCLGPSISIDRSGIEPERLALVDCAGRPREEARRALSLLARPWGAPRPALPEERAPLRKSEAESRKRRPGGDRAAAREKPSGLPAGEIAPGVRLLDPGLLSRIDALTRRYPGRLVSLVSGYRPQSRGSLHQTGRALDLRIAGVRNDELAAACRALADTGCGYYPNSSFVHVDVRAPGTGSVAWIDASGPGEQPRYVASWPPPQDEAQGAAAAGGAPGEDAEEVLRRERRERPAVETAGAVAEKAGAAAEKASEAAEKAGAAAEKAGAAAEKAVSAAEKAGEAAEKASEAAEEAGAAAEKAISATERGSAAEKADAGEDETSAPAEKAGAAAERAGSDAPAAPERAAPKKAGATPATRAANDMRPKPR